jgi:hypothetical protein
MQPTLSPVDNDPHDVLEIAPDVVLVARAEEELSRLAREAKTKSGDRSSQPRIEPTLPQTDPFVTARDVPAVDTSFRAAATGEGPSMARRLSRGVAGLLLAVCVGGAAVAWRASGEVAKEAISTLAPQFAAKVLPPSDTNPPAEQDPAAPAAPVQQATAEAPAAASAETTPAAATTAPAAPTALAAAAAAAIPADQSQRMQSMARDLASLGQEVAVLKASLAELKATNEQMSHDMAKLSEQNQRLKLSALQAKAAIPPVRKPAPAFRPTQAAVAPPPYPPPQAAVPPQYPPTAAPYPPPQAAYVPPPGPVAQPPVDPDIPRPPMPLRQ